MAVALVLPTYNERENAGDLIEQILSLNLAIDIIVVDDSSPDGTGELVDKIAARNPRVHVIHRPCRQGLGTAHVAGMRYAFALKADPILTMDADFSHHPSFISALLARSRTHHVVIGSRYVPQGSLLRWGLARRALSKTANLFAHLALGLAARDCTSGFRCYRRAALESLDLDRMFSNGYSFLLEILFKCTKLGYRVTEVPIVFENRRRGKSKISSREMFRALWTVARLTVDRARYRLFPRAVREIAAPRLRLHPGRERPWSK